MEEIVQTNYLYVKILYKLSVLQAKVSCAIISSINLTFDFRVIDISISQKLSPSQDPISRVIL
jgi:hypothetical protein